MMYESAWDGRGYVVARIGAIGATVEMECPTDSVAAREADRLNRQEQARQERLMRKAPKGERKGVRYFDADEFA